MSDTIYRQDAINVLEGLSACEEYGVEVGTDEETYIGKYEAITAISDLPSADRPKGKWIDKGWHGDWQFETDGRGNCWHEYECSECGYRKRGGKSNFCPDCGADMRGDKE